MTDPDQHLPDPVLSRQATAGRFLRFIYASVVIFLGLFLAWQLVKPFIYTQSAGSVVAPYAVVSTPFTSRIVELAVKPGEAVRKGQIVAKVRSPEIDALRANLVTGVAQQVNKAADLSIRLLVAKETLEPAKRRAAASNQCAETLDQHPGSVTTVFRSDVLRECAEATANLARIEAEITELSRQLSMVEQAKQDVEEVREFVKHAFNDGNQIAPITGIVANRTANPGQSVTAGTSIVEIYNPAELYIQWVMSADRLRQPDVGAPVYVLDGNRVMRGTVKTVYSLAEEAMDGKTIFATRSAGQLVRIELPEGEPYPAYMTDVEVRYNYWRFMDPAVNLYVETLTLLGLWREP